MTLALEKKNVKNSRTVQLDSKPSTPCPCCRLFSPPESLSTRLLLIRSDDISAKSARKRLFKPYHEFLQHILISVSAQILTEVPKKLHHQKQLVPRSFSLKSKCYSRIKLTKKYQANEIIHTSCGNTHCIPFSLGNLNSKQSLHFQSTNYHQWRY